MKSNPVAEEVAPGETPGARDPASSTTLFAPAIPDLIPCEHGDAAVRVVGNRGIASLKAVELG